jgi:hypothetical protein
MARAPINWPVDEEEDLLPDPKTQPAKRKRRAAWAAAMAGIALLLAACSATPDPTSTAGTPTAEIGRAHV